MADYEKLGLFYLGREFDIDQSELQPEQLHYDAKDLTTHAVIVGMTGSGKTGLGITLLEEAAIDGIPALIIDPKGDMGNLLLNFPNLQAKDFLPWVDQSEATRKGMTVEEFAKDRAALWKKGLASWDQDSDRMQRLKSAAEVAIYTPGSDAGVPLKILKSLDAPPAEVLNDADAMRERISTAVSGLLTLLGIDADPLRSREHILLSNILDTAWRAGRNLDMSALIREIQEPPFQKIGIMDLEAIFPSKDRMQLALTVNNVLASPAFSSWMQGEPLNIQKLLYNNAGKPRLAVLSIAHLNDQERMFFVTLLLNEVVAWMRTQSGTSSLRALLYMDEVFGYLPPTANPPSKLPMLTLLKQARAFGLGLVLSTQNPVDLDYKALSNAGTWFLGRLQTERDQQRVLDGLQGASVSAGVEFDRDRIERILSGVGSRVFLLNNVHEDQPVVFQTRWAMSYLSGPMTRAQIAELMAPFKESRPANATSVGSAAIASSQNAVVEAPSAENSRPPVLTVDVEQRFVSIARHVPRDARIHYRPALMAKAALHFVDSKSDVDLWKDAQFLLPIDADEALDRDPWEAAESISSEDYLLDDHPTADASYAELPAECSRKTSWKSWDSTLKSYLYRERRLDLHYCKDLKEYSRPDDREGDFVARIKHQSKEKRDLDIAKLRKKYESKFETLRDRIMSAEHRVAEEKEQASSATMSAVVSIGTSILGAMFGRKTLSATNISKAGTSMRSASRAADQRRDIARAEEKVEELQEDVKDLEDELEKETEKITEEYEDDHENIELYQVKPRKSDIAVDDLCVVWLPFEIDNDGILEPAFEQ